MPEPSSFPLPLLIGALAGAAVAVASPAAIAQVTTSQGALDSLGGGRPHHAAPDRANAAHRSAARKPAHPAAHAAAGRRGDAAHPAAPVRPAPVRPAPPAATIPAAPPPAPVFRAPVVNVPLHPPPPPPPVPVVQTATGTASPLPDGTRITFGGGSADLNPATMTALHGFADRVKNDPASHVALDSSAAGTPDDPSTPRRLALSRGLAARAVLINDGIASTRIYVRVFGPPAPGADAPPDRVDLHAVGDGAAAPAPPTGAQPPVPASTTPATPTG